jgi:outer membrane immunogenic protein
MTKRHLGEWLFVSASSLAIATSAFAADRPVKAPLMAPHVETNWAGPYAGLNIGLARHSWAFDLYDDGDPFAGWSGRETGASFGAQAGYNWQRGSYVYGVEADINWLDIGASQAFPGLLAETNIDWLSTFRVRLGVTASPTLFYLTAGVALGSVENVWRDRGVFSGAGDLGSSDTQWGWTAGAGIEHMFAPNWTGRIEFRYTDLGKSDGTLVAGDVYTSEFRNDLIEVRLGLNYRW